MSALLIISDQIAIDHEGSRVLAKEAEDGEEREVYRPAGREQ